MAEFWGLVVKAGETKSVNIPADHVLTVSNAAFVGKGAETAKLYAGVDRKYVLCTVAAGRTEQVSLDVTFFAGNPLSIGVEGAGEIHLVGSIQFAGMGDEDLDSEEERADAFERGLIDDEASEDDEDDEDEEDEEDEDGEDDEDDEEEEIPAPKKPSQKALPAPAPAKPAAPAPAPAKKEAAKAAAPAKKEEKPAAAPAKKEAATPAKKEDKKPTTPAATPAKDKAAAAATPSKDKAAAATPSKDKAAAQATPGQEKKRPATTPGKADGEKDAKKAKTDAKSPSGLQCTECTPAKPMPNAQALEQHKKAKHSK
eukprot:TRINITY_DN92_c0_g1_i1.p2 TRINITY_DN92_c0_g1~~TRINITY_DN92_c0_g1_i1.p2  ORF type:complete len:313 (+),score=149.19 TRINITY_DN92_c0_g1_i1:79-1017(+)